MIPASGRQPTKSDTLNSAALWRIGNIGNCDRVRFLDFDETIEAELDRLAQRRYLPTQTSGLPATWADCILLQHLTGYAPRTPFRERGSTVCGVV